MAVMIGDSKVDLFEIIFWKYFYNFKTKIIISIEETFEKKRIKYLKIKFFFKMRTPLQDIDHLNCTHFWMPPSIDRSFFVCFFLILKWSHHFYLMDWHLSYTIACHTISIRTKSSFIFRWNLLSLFNYLFWKFGIVSLD